jgi:hypothetical protein
MMLVKIDCHFHPNLPNSDVKAAEKAKGWWQALRKNEVDGVIVSEHAYKDPERAYRFMSKAVPKGMYCVPGMEYITKEGIDIVMFSRSPEDIYIEKLKPFALTYDEVLDLIKNNDKIYGYVTHPYTLGLTSVVNKKGSDYYSKVVNELGAVEISNGAFDNLINLFEAFPFKYFFKKKIKQIHITQHLPEEDYPKKVKFLAAGSDAHQFSEVGNAMVIDMKEDVFDSIITNKSRHLQLYKRDFSLWELIVSARIVLGEFLIKRKLKLCGY